MACGVSDLAVWGVVSYLGEMNERPREKSDPDRKEVASRGVLEVGFGAL